MRSTVAGAVAAFGLGVAAGARSRPRIGAFTSAAAADRFTAAYQRAFAELPRPDATLDLRTGYGVVRVYGYTGADPDAAPLVLLPGRASAAPVWAGNLASLRALRSVWLVDLLGEPGMSVQSRPMSDDADQAQWLHQALAALRDTTGAPAVHLAGMSIGGWTATNLAIREPEGIASVTLLDPAATFAPIPAGTVARSLPASVRWLPRSWREAFASYTAGGAPVAGSATAELIEAGMQAYAMALPPPAPFAEPDLARIDVPVLVLLAGRSVMHRTASAAATARRTLRRGVVLVRPDATHAINGEHPAWIAQQLAAFLEETGA